MNLTEDQIADLIISTWLMAVPGNKAAYERFKSCKKEDLIDMHFGLGGWIRNTYGLWGDSPLTEEWRLDRENDGRKYITETGVDAHPQHPDEVSMRIITLIWEKVNA
jgi:hypothetical protein